MVEKTTTYYIIGRIHRKNDEFVEEYAHQIDSSGWIEDYDWTSEIGFADKWKDFQIVQNRLDKLRGSIYGIPFIKEVQIKDIRNIY